MLDAKSLQLSLWTNQNICGIILIRHIRKKPDAEMRYVVLVFGVQAVIAACRPLFQKMAGIHNIGTTEIISYKKIQKGCIL